MVTSRPSHQVCVRSQAQVSSPSAPSARYFSNLPSES